MIFDDSATLRLKEVSKSFHAATPTDAYNFRSILNHINCEVHQAEIVGIVGRTGAGKTTLGRIMTGIMRPEHGSVSIGSVDVHGLTSAEFRKLRKWIRYVPQNPDASVASYVSVPEAFAEATSQSRLDKSGLEDWKRQLLQEPIFKSSWLGRKMGDLSVGERKRVINLRALLTYPKFIVLDEPFNGLDLRSKAAFLALLRSVSREHRLSITVISHDREALNQIADRTLLLEHGELVPVRQESED